jgi:CRISPR/Cas system CMR-associated protein Cmr1 (group 7 of RAMP superfamily)
LGANPKKGIKSFVAEHIFVREQRLHLGADKPSDVIQSFIHTFRGSGIQYTEVLEQAEFDFTVETDRKFDDEFWAMLWLTGQRQGIGATRSQGFGAFTITEWEPLGEVKPVRRKRAA